MKKAEEKCEQAQEQAVAGLSEREKRALAAERRIAAQLPLAECAAAR